MDKLRWGVISTAKIGIEKVIPAIRRSQLGVVHAIASRDLARAEAAARDLGIPQAYGSYEELLADPKIEAVYNPLPNQLHVPVTLQAARAGKHVLCEKPIAMSAEEAGELAAIGKAPLVMEAFMVRFHPQWQKAKELVEAGALGRLVAVQVFFSYSNRDAANIRNRPETGGGALYDIGCYAILSGRYLFGAEPRRAISLIERDPDFGTDRLTSALVDFGEGRRLDFTVSTQAVPYQRVGAYGTEKRLEIVVPYNAPPDQPMRIRLDDGSAAGGASAQTIELPAMDQYAAQADAFVQAVRGTAPLPYGLSDAVAGMKVIDALFRSERSGGWEQVG